MPEQSRSNKVRVDESRRIYLPKGATELYKGKGHITLYRTMMPRNDAGLSLNMLVGDPNTGHIGSPDDVQIQADSKGRAYIRFEQQSETESNLERFLCYGQPLQGRVIRFGYSPGLTMIDQHFWQEFSRHFRSEAQLDADAYKQLENIA